MKHNTQNGTYITIRIHKHNSTYEQLVHVLSSADVARRLMLIAKRDKGQFVVKT